MLNRRRMYALAAGCAAAGSTALAYAADAAPLKQSLMGMIWTGMEWPAWFILGGSVTAISLIVEHFIMVRRLTIAPAEQVKKARQLIEARNFRECLDQMRRSSTYFATVMSAALSHARHGFDAMHEAAVEKSSELSGRMFRKVEYLNILGNLGPLMGLLGTVLGMIIAFAGLAESGGNPSAGRLAQGISLALVNTLLGLGLAVIGMGFFGVCRNRIDSLTVGATVDVLDLLEYFRPTGATAGARPAEPARAAATAPQVGVARSPELPAAQPG